MVGTNNHEHTAEQVAGGIKAIIECIREKQPQALVLVLVSHTSCFWKFSVKAKDDPWIQRFQNWVDRNALSSNASLGVNISFPPGFLFLKSLNDSEGNS
jgi:hypothetical protein